MPTEYEVQVDSLISTIKKNQSFLLTCHINPDGDALGSSLAMAHALKSINKQVCITFPEPFVVPYSLNKALVGTELLSSVGDLEESNSHYDVAMTFDCGSKDRLVGLERLFERCSVLANVDHHLANEHFGDVNVIDSNAASSGSVVLDILDRTKIELNANIAQCLYVTLLTDTGRFQFSSTTPQVFEQAKRLSSYGLDIAMLSRVLSEEDSYSFLKLAGEVLSNMTLNTDIGLVSAVTSIEQQKKFGVSYDQTEGLIEFIRRTRESNVACVIKEFQPRDYRVSLRSLGEIDVCAIAKTFGGGGHKFAAGFSSHEDPNEIINSISIAIAAQNN